MAANELDVRRLRKPGSYDWEYLDKGPTVWRIRIGKLIDTPPPVR